MRVAVVGGGFAGMAVAARLAKQGHDVALHESTDRLGGALVPVEQDGYRWDGGPTSTLLPAVLRDLFRKTGRPLERELDLVAVTTPRRHVFADDTVLDLPCGGRGDQTAAVDRLEPGLGARWTTWVDGWADTWEALRRDWLERPWPESGAQHAAPAARKALASRTSLQRATRVLRDGRLRDAAESAAVLDGQHPRDVPAWAAVSDYVERAFGTWTVPADAGGMGRLAEVLTARLSTRGVTVHTGTAVLDLEVAGGRVTGVRTAVGTHPTDVAVVATDPRRLPALASYVARTRPAMPPTICHVGLEGEVPDLPHEVVLHGDPMLWVRRSGVGPDADHHAWTLLGRGTVAEDLVTAIARRGVRVRDQVVTRVDLSPADLVRGWHGSPHGVLWQGRGTLRHRLGTRTPIEGAYVAGAHTVPGAPGAGLAYAGLSAALVAQVVGPAR